MTTGEARAILGDQVYERQVAAARAGPPLTDAQITALAPLLAATDDVPVVTDTAVSSAAA